MKDYRDCPYWKDNRCSGFNCCLEKDCKHAEKYQPWLKKVVPKPPKWMVGLEPGREGIWL